VNNEISYLNNNEKAAFGYRIAALGGKRISNNWTLEAGVAYIENCTVLNLNFSDRSDTRRGFEDNENLDSAELKNCLSDTGIPIRIIWRFGAENLKVPASLGISPQILLDQRTDILIKYLDGDTEKSDYMNADEAAGFNLSPSLGLGAEFKLNDRFFLRAEGVARSGAVNSNKGSAINSYLYGSELNVGIYYVII
jgi:hypothetical protein